MTDNFEVDTWKHRAIALLNQTIHFFFAKNRFWCVNIVGAMYYFAACRGELIKWYEIALKIRKNKAITPFQHSSCLFLTQPSIYQLFSIRYGLNKRYRKYINNEIKKRDLFLNHIPRKYHPILFPWITDDIRSLYDNNKGIGEFTWVYSKDDNRLELIKFLCDNWIITLINTTWVYHTASKLDKNNSKFICDNLTYLPNLNQMKNRQIIKCAQALTKWCEYKKY